jgi:hypothetical protein
VIHTAGINGVAGDGAARINGTGNGALTFARAGTGSIKLGDRAIGCAHKTMVDAAGILIAPATTPPVLMAIAPEPWPLPVPELGTTKVVSTPSLVRR